MAQSLSQLYVHIVFSTKNRQPFLQDQNVRDSVFAYMAGICRNLDSPSNIIGGTDDHVHGLVRLSRKIRVSDLLRDLKRDTTAWIKLEWRQLGEFQWQAGYGAFSVSPGHVLALTKYIENQEEHHRKVTYQDEFRKLCQKYEIALDERYAWD